MAEATKTAVDVLVEIAEKTDATASDETRIRAACAILDRQEIIKGA